VRRWEQKEGLPVHRHSHQKQATVYAFRGELDTWLASRAEQAKELAVSRAPSRRHAWIVLSTSVAAAVAIAFGVSLWRSNKPHSPVVKPITSYPGMELFPSLSPDGKFCLAGHRRAAVDMTSMCCLSAAKTRGD